MPRLCSRDVDRDLSPQGTFSECLAHSVTDPRVKNPDSFEKKQVPFSFQKVDWNSLPSAVTPRSRFRVIRSTEGRVARFKDNSSSSVKKRLPGILQTLAACCDSSGVPPPPPPGGHPGGKPSLEGGDVTPQMSGVSPETAMHSASPKAQFNPNAGPVAEPGMVSDPLVAPSHPLLGLTKLGNPKVKPLPTLRNVPAPLQGFPPGPCSFIKNDAVDMDLDSTPNVSVKNRFSILSSFHRDVVTGPSGDGTASLHPVQTGASTTKGGDSGAPLSPSSVPKNEGVRPPPYLCTKL